MNSFQAYSIQKNTYSSEGPSDVVSALSSVSFSTPRPKTSSKPCPYCTANKRSDNLHTEDTCPLKSARRKEAHAENRPFPEKPCGLCLSENGKHSYHFERNHRSQSPRPQPQVQHSSNQLRSAPSQKSIASSRALIASVDEDDAASIYDSNTGSANYAHGLASDGYSSFPAIAQTPPS